MKRPFFVLTVFFAALAVYGASVAESGPPRFAIYRVDLVPGESEPRRDPGYFSQEYILANAVRHEFPILTEVNILDFCWDTQRVTLDDEGVRRWGSQGGFETPLTGLPLIVYVDDQPRYAAMLWNPVSSRMSRHPMIWSWVMNHRITIGGRRVTADGDTIVGPNYDPEVKRVLTELDLLADPCPE